LIETQNQQVEEGRTPARPNDQAGLAAAALADYRAAIGRAGRLRANVLEDSLVALPILVLVLAVFGYTALVIAWCAIFRRPCLLTLGRRHASFC